MQNNIENIGDFFSCYKKAAWEKDSSSMISLYADDVIVFDMWDNGFCCGLTQWTSVITEWLTSLQDDQVNVMFEMTDIQQDEHIAFASAVIQFQAIATDGSVLRSMKNRMSLGFIKTGNFWKVKHQHISAPVDSDLKAILNI